MPYLTWQEDFSVGVKDFDEDHKKIVNFINKLHLGFISGEGVAAMKEVLNGLVDYTAIHFKKEEDSMEKYNYPEKDTHKAAHDSMVNKVKEFQENYDQGKTAFSLELMSFLRDWLINHIRKTDMAYKKFFNDAGLS